MSHVLSRPRRIRLVPLTIPLAVFTLLVAGCSPAADPSTGDDDSALVAEATATEDATEPHVVTVQLSAAGAPIAGDVGFTVYDDDATELGSGRTDAGSGRGSADVAATGTVSVIFDSADIAALGYQESELTVYVDLITDQTESVAEAVLTVPPVPAPSVTIPISSPNGYSFDLTLAVDKPTTGGENGEHVIGSVCDFDSNVDIAIPVKMTVTATTESFATPINAHVIAHHASDLDYAGSGVAPMRDDDRLRVEEYYSSSSECRTWSTTNLYGYGQPEAAGAKWDTPIEQGQQGVHYFTVIVKNFRNPNTPDGDTALLDYIELHSTWSNNTDGTTGTYQAVNSNLGTSTVGITLAGNIVGG